MDERTRIEEIKNSLKKNVYEQAAKIQVEQTDDSNSTEKLSNILEGYVDRINTMEADNMEEFEEELKVLKKSNVEVGDLNVTDDLVKQYNDYIHNDLDRTIEETIEYTHNINNKTEDLNEILIRSIEREDDIVVSQEIKEKVIDSQDEEAQTDEFIEIEATTDLGIFDDIVKLENDTLDIEQKIETDDDVYVKEEKKSKTTKRNKQSKEVKEKKVKEPKQKKSKNDDFEDEKGLSAFDYVLIIILVVIFLILISLVAKINGVM